MKVYVSFRSVTAVILQLLSSQWIFVLYKSGFENCAVSHAPSQAREIRDNLLQKEFHENI